MRKKLAISAIVVVLAICIYNIYIQKPTKKIDMDTYGIKYKYVDENYQESVKMKVEGEYYNKIFIGKKFEGMIHIDDYILYSLILEFEDQNKSLLDSYSPWLSMRGRVYIDDNFDKVTIAFDECVIGDWNIEENLMLSAPALNRDEALKISQELIFNKN